MPVITVFQLSQAFILKNKHIMTIVGGKRITSNASYVIILLFSSN